MLYLPFKAMDTIGNLNKFIQIYTNLYKFIQIYTNLYKFINKLSKQLL